MLYCQQAGYKLGDAAARTQTAKIALGRKDRYLPFTIAKDLLQPASLPNVSSHGTESLGVDMVNVLGADPGFRQSAANGSRQPGARTSTIERRAETG